MASPPRPWPTSSLLTVRRHTGTAVGTLGRQLHDHEARERRQPAVSMHMHAQRSHTQARTRKREPKRCGCAPAGPETPELCCIGRAPGRKGTSFWPRRAPVCCRRNCCVCVGCFGVDARTWQRRRAATAPRRLHKKKKKPDVVASRSGGVASAQAHRRQAAGPFRPCSPNHWDPPCLWRARRPSPAAPAHLASRSQLARQGQARATTSPGPVVCARASRAFTDPIVVFSRDDDDRNRSTAEFASGGIVQRDWFASRGPVAPAAAAPRASSVAVQVKHGGVAGAEVHSRCVAYKQALPAAAAAIFDSVMLCPVRSLLCVASRLGERNLAGKLGVVGHLA